MMTPKSLLIPLYFDETEADLWLALQQIELEKTSSFIKETLRYILLSTNKDVLFINSLHNKSEDRREIPADGGDHQKEDEAEVLETQTERIDTFCLDDLFAQTPGPHPDEEHVIVTEHEEVQSIPNGSPGFEYLMKHIIGIEEDEAVLKVLGQKSERD